MSLIKRTDPRLREESSPFNFQEGVEYEGKTLYANDLFELLKEVMIEHNGIGLAAPQLGIMKKVFILGNPREPETIIPVFNPLIVHASDDQVYYEEGCLTFPGLFVKVKRPATIRARYTTNLGETNSINFEGLTARIFLHEYGHLHGVLMTDLAHKTHLDSAYTQQKKLNRERKRNEKSRISA